MLIYLGLVYPFQPKYGPKMRASKYPSKLHYTESIIPAYPHSKGIYIDLQSYVKI